MNSYYVYYKIKLNKTRQKLSRAIISCSNKVSRKQKHLLKKFNFLQDNCGNTILHIAILHNNKKIIKYLLKNNADKNIKNKYGIKPEDLVYNIEIKKLLDRY